MFNSLDTKELISEDSFFEKNRQKMNQIVCKAMAYAFIAFPAMLIINAMGIFKFSNALIFALVIVGSFCTLSPVVVSRFVKNQVFIQYYALICIIVLVSYLGTRYHVGIYITFILASIVSCLYFEKKFTVQIVVLSYIGYLISYYFRSIAIRNHLYPTETVMENFVPLAAGFTIEFVVSLLFLYKLVDRAHTLLVEQKQMIDELSKSEAKMQLALDATKDILFEYDIEKDCFSSNGTIRGWGRKEIKIEHFMDYIHKMEWKTQDFLESVEKYRNIPEEMGNRFQEELCLSFQEDGKEYPVWAYFELTVMRGSEGNPLTVIGKLRDITQQKLELIKIEEAKKFDTLTGMYHYASLRKIVKESEGQFPAMSHQIMIVHVKNSSAIASCYGDIYSDFVLMNVSEVIKNAVKGEDILTCRLSDVVFLAYVEDSDRIDGKEIRQGIKTGLDRLYIGEKEVGSLDYDFGYYIGEEAFDDLVTVALRYVNAEKPPVAVKDTVTEKAQEEESVVGSEQTFQTLLKAEKKAVSENFLKNILTLLEETRDMQSAMQMSLVRVGRFFGLSGVRIYLLSETEEVIYPAFLWADNEKLKKECSGTGLTYEVRSFFVENFGRSRVVDNTIGAFQDFFRQFGENPLLFSRCSSLICPVLPEKAGRVIIVYDIAVSGYTWSDEQKEFLLETSSVLGEYLRKEGKNESEAD